MEKIIKICEKCGKEFEPSKYTPYQKYCPDCVKKSGDTPEPVEKTCPICGKKFTTTNANQKFDTVACRSASYKNGTPVHDVEETCTNCGETFMKAKYHPYITLCEKCRKEIKSERAKVKRAEKARTNLLR